MSLIISPREYFGKKPHSVEQEASGIILLAKVDSLLAEALLNGVPLEKDPDTQSYISGSKGGAGDGGFRLPASTTGAKNSSHKEAKGIDIYDPLGLLNAFITDHLLESIGLYREDPDATPGWVHLTTRAPTSKKRTFPIK